MTMIKILSIQKLSRELQRFYTDHIDPDGIQPIHALRTVVAAILAILLYHSLSWPQAYWILSSSVLILQTYNAPTPRQKWISLTFTGLSVVLGTFIASFLGHWMLLLGLFLMLTTFISVYLNVISSDVGTAAFYVNLFCLMSGAFSVDGIETLERTISVFLGFIIAVIVCACLWPERLSSTIRFIISENLWRLLDFNRVLTERKQSEKAIMIRRNRLWRGFTRARNIIPSEEIQSWQMIYQIEYLYDIILSLHEIKYLLEKQKILRIIHKELSILSRRLNWLLRGLARYVQTNTNPPQISKFMGLLRTFEKYYTRHFKRFNHEQLLIFTVYIDTVQKLERRVMTLAALVRRMGYPS